MSTNNEYRSLLLKYLPRPIRSEKEYKRAMAQLEKIMTPHPSAATGQIIELLSTLIESYESQVHPTPQGSPVQALRHLLEVRGLKCAHVAKQTGIAPATLSNVLANRRSISKTNSMKLAGFFDVSPVVFLEADVEDVSDLPIEKRPQGRTLPTQSMSGKIDITGGNMRRHAIAGGDFTKPRASSQVTRSR
jgi:HTH-type transcriptional regulator / antitoxin HigA